MRKGFTIVELLIVIVLIAILAAITIIAYRGFQDRSRQSKIQSDVNTISKAISLARYSKSLNLVGITANDATGSACWDKPDGTNLATLAASDPCIANYTASMNAISVASGVGGLSILRDPWGRPYLIDENESEGSPSNCTKDTVAVFRLPLVTGYGVYGSTPANNVANGGFTGC